MQQGKLLVLVQSSWSRSSLVQGSFCEERSVTPIARKTKATSMPGMACLCSAGVSHFRLRDPSDGRMLTSIIIYRVRTFPFRSVQ